ncbi:uncharacterized protein [Nicotiana tomentosiformis]|uniref:uncharacterized protein n=1 Tax=Nicotiana tomentosiformis TaxID=4098 RepID=UPI00388C92A2
MEEDVYSAFFDLLDEMKKLCNFNFLEGDKFVYLRGPNIAKRKIRGPTRCVKIINLQEGQKLVVQFDEDYQAIGENATDFTWFLGQTVRSRTCCPLKVNGWKEIEQDKIDHMWDIILNKPKLLTIDEWKYLVNLWSDVDFQKKSTQNKANRSKRSLRPYSGTKSYARLRYKMEKKNGKAPSRVEVFLESRKRKKGKQVDAFQQDVIVQFDQLKEQQKEGEISLNDDDIFEKVLMRAAIAKSPPLHSGSLEQEHASMLKRWVPQHGA